MSVLVVAEKPSVARDLAEVLGCAKKGDGFLYGGGYVVSWALGHLAGLCDPEEYSAEYKKWDFSYLPIIPPKIKLKIMPKTRTQFTTLKKLMLDNEVSELVCATDAGREGELIFRYIYALTGCKKPFKRLWISSLTKASIKKGFSQLKDGREYDSLYNSAKCRSEADWLVGINASRAYTISYGVLLSVGRVQTPTLSFLTARKKEIDSFVSSKYWEVSASFGSKPPYDGIWFDVKTNETKIDDAEKAHQIEKTIKDKIGVVSDISTEDVKKPPPLLFDLTELQRECNRKLGLSAKKTLEIAQTLYERHKAITYPRTDSRCLSSDMYEGVGAVLKSFEGKHGELAAPLLALSKLPFSKRVFDNSKITDHHAIIPTGKKAHFSEMESKVYDLIARRLIASFYPDYRYRSTKVTTICENQRFLTRGTEVTDVGWTLVLGREKKNDENDEQTIPALAVGETYPVSAVKIAEKQTQPPKPYTDATLLSAMEHAGKFVEDEQLREQLKESGIGTPATRAQIIERLIEVGYVQRSGKTLCATEKGVKLIEVVPKELKSPETTAKWERALNRISKGEMDCAKFENSIKRYVHYIVEEAKKVNDEVKFDEEPRRVKRAARTAKTSYGRKKRNG